jgi:ATP-dependent DNA helicase RecG
LSPTENNLAAPLTELKGVGPALARTLERLGAFRVEDLLFLLPLRYEDRTRLVSLGEIRPGDRCLVSGEVRQCETVYRGRRSLLVHIGDETGEVTLRFFYFTRRQQAQFREGVRVSCYGDVRSGSGGLEIIHPEYRILKADQSPVISDALTPIYSITEGIQQGRLRNLVGQALKIMRSDTPVELLPDEVLSSLDMPSLAAALLYLHDPPPEADLHSIELGKHPCQLRLSFEELLAHYMSLRNLRLLASRKAAPAMTKGSDEVLAFINSLPYQLTHAQQRVCSEIAEDMRQPHPMMRLIQGDVGSGKTVVAAVACQQVIACGNQAAVMAPTELLAEQHWHNFNEWFDHSDIKLAWLSGSQGKKDRRASLELIASGEADLIVGTHALFQEAVEFHDLALIIIDEQHRFGVHQRMALRDKGVGASGHPHQLVMTATPIPRTLAMAAYADLDTSIIDELPPGRQPVRTVVMPDTRRDEVVERIREACVGGQQAYWVCPLIEESEVLNYEAAEARYAHLRQKLPELNIGLVHGRMKPAARDKVMGAFKDGGISLLVATTVIEVGVDVPNASLMIIENAERMGLSQLHQLRGRVGRGRTQSHCVLLYRHPLGQLARSRLTVLRDSNDGFLVAQRDLELRGPGELLGTRQTGLPQYRIADLVRDADLMPEVLRVATMLQSTEPANAALIIRRWLGDAGRYGKV